MGLLDILAFPVTGPINFVTWLAEQIAEQADKQYYSEDALRGQLMDLEMKLDMGEITEAQYNEGEEVLLALMKRVREIKQSQIDSGSLFDEEEEG